MYSIFQMLNGILYDIGYYLLLPLFAGAGAATWQLLYNKYKKRNLHSIAMNTRKNVELLKVLSELLGKTNTSQSYLSLFHNGDKFMDGSPIIKLSRMCEVCAPGIKSAEDKFQSIPVSTIAWRINLLLDNKAHVYNVDEVSNGRYKNMLVSEGIQVRAEILIKKNSDIIGILGLDNHSDEQIDIEPMEYYAILISEILSN
jgi:hypothetical protein